MRKLDTALLVLLGLYLWSQSSAAPKPGLGKLGPQSPKLR
jgi:hypothetical protein